MSTIVFCVHPITGSVNATLKLAKQLRSRGHRIYYLGLADCEDYVGPHRFDFKPVFERWFPKGWFKKQFGQREPRESFVSRLVRTRRRLLYIRTFLYALVHGQDDEFHSIVKGIRTDLFIIVATHYDSFVWALLAHKAGVVSVYLNDTLCRSMSPFVPPITTGNIPTDSCFSRWNTTWAWMLFFAKRFMWQKVFTLGVDLISHKLIRQLARSCRYPADCVDTANDLLGPKLKLREIILCPRNFDFHSCESPHRYYVEASIDTDRGEVSFPWKHIHRDQPLVYCALGTLSCMTRSEYMRFYSVVIDLARTRHHQQFVVAIGNNISQATLAPVPHNVMLVGRAPQLGLLKRTSIMINHGGMNTVKECIFFGVPMVVFPLAFDEYGNAARVVRHGLGVRGNMKKVNLQYLQSLIEMCENNTYIRTQVTRMQRRFREYEDRAEGLRIIESLLACNEGQGMIMHPLEAVRMPTIGMSSNVFRL